MKNPKILLAISSVILSSSVFAGSAMEYHEEEIFVKKEPKEKVVYEEVEIEIEIEEEAEPYWEILLLGGTAKLDADNNLLHVTDVETDKITQDNEGDWKSWTVQFGLGYVIPLWDSEKYSDEIQWLPAIEPQLNAYFLKGNVEGDVDRFYQYPGNFSDTDYKIDLESTRLMFDVALTLASWRNLSVYGIAGLGPSWNRVGYQTGVENGATVHLNDHTQTNFAYEFGGGLSYSLSEHLSITAEYLYAGFTDIELSENGHVGNDEEISEVESSDFDLNSQAVFLGFRFAL